MSDKEFDEQLNIAINLANGPYNESRGIKPSQKRAEVLKKIGVDSIQSDKNVYKTESVIISNTGIPYMITNSYGQAVGRVTIESKKIKSVFELVNSRPVFKIYKNLELHAQYDIMGLRMKKQKSSNEVREEFRANIENIDKAKVIYELIDARNYEAIDNYINYCMEYLINNIGNNNSLKSYTDAYTQAQVLTRSIHNAKTRNDEKEIDVLYRQICLIFINMGFFDIPNLDAQLITKR